MADYSSSKFNIFIIDKFIYKVDPAEGVDIEVEDVREMRSVFLKFSDGKPFAILLDATKTFTPSNEVRILLASKEYTDLRVAAAFVTTTLANKLLGNFFIKFNRPASLTKLFTNEPTALAWLREQVNNHK